MKRKLVACLLAGAMLIGAVPVTALAEETALLETTDEEAPAETAEYSYRGIKPLSANAQKIYDALKVQVRRAAKEGGSTEFYLENLNLVYPDNGRVGVAFYQDLMDVENRLAMSESDDLYWNQARENEVTLYDYDIVDDSDMDGESRTCLISSVTLALPVALEYREEKDQPYEMSTDTTAYLTAMQNAEAVIRAAAPLSDWEKLNYYKDYICRMADVDEATLTVFTDEEERQLVNSVPAGVWDSHSIFDEDPTTKSDAQAYARAFLYLCSQSTFLDPEFACYVMVGMAGSDQEERPHLYAWNQVYLDGTMYLVDLFRCDRSAADLQDSFFMVSKQEEAISHGYIIDINGDRIAYQVRLDIWKQYEDWVLQLGSDTEPVDPKDLTITELQERIAELREKLAQAEADQDAAKADRGAADEYAAELKEQITALEKQLDVLQKQEAENAKSVQMLRLYNPNSGEHFYTANAAERDYLVKLGWKFEGIGWNAPKKSNTPVYRLYNPNAGDHHYTTSIAERNMLLKAGWNDEQIGWYAVDKDKQADAVPVYRQYNPNAKKAGSHNFTTSQGEAKHLASIGWKDEGIAWYGTKH